MYCIVAMSWSSDMINTMFGWAAAKAGEAVPPSNMATEAPAANRTAMEQVRIRLMMSSVFHFGGLRYNQKSSPVCAQTERRGRCRAGEELAWR